MLQFLSFLLLGYFEGIRDNLRLMPYYYPGWIMRLYHDLSNDEPSMKVSQINTNTQNNKHIFMYKFSREFMK